MIEASDFRELKRNTPEGFLTLSLWPCGLVIRDCALHSKNGRRWVALPSKAQIDKDGVQPRDPTTGRGLWTPLIEIPDKPAWFVSALTAAIREQRSVIAAFATAGDPS